MQTQDLRASQPVGVCLVWLSLLFLLPAPACASPNSIPSEGNAGPIFNLGHDSLRMASLDGLWRFKSGDDPRWADPNFDDSSWALVRSDKSWPEQGLPVVGGLFWYRTKVLVPAGSGPLSLYMPVIHLNYQVFVDGRLVGTMGVMPPHPRAMQSVVAVFPVSAVSMRAHTVTLAIRAWRYPVWNAFYLSGLEPGMLMGDSRLIQQTWLLHTRDLFWQSASNIFLTLLEILAGIAALALFWVRGHEKEYLWFGVAMLVSAVGNGIETHRVFHPSAVLSLNLLQSILAYAAMFAFVGFYRHLLKIRRDRFYWFVIGCVSVAMAINVAGFTPWALSEPSWFPFLWFPAVLLFQVPFYVWTLNLLVRKTMQQRADALLLLLSNAPGLVGLYVAFMQFVAKPALGWKVGAMDWYFNTARWPFPASVDNIGSFLLMLTMFGILVYRFTRTSLQEDEHKREIEAARVVQQILIPDAIPTVPGFTIHAVYKPASQVGGDFFQVIPIGSAGVLVIIGDVSGKGMPAAMTVSLLVGTVRTLAHYTQRPGEILTAMNQRMLARSGGGFTTCLVLRVDADGTLTAANAGHLFPYLQGKELPVESSLPLGLAAEAIYNESIFHLADNHQLTVVTDGVLEARGKEGELFGFERTADISRQSAESVAQIAVDFGQEDDITVVTLMRSVTGDGSAALKVGTISSPLEPRAKFTAQSQL